MRRALFNLHLYVAWMAAAFIVVLGVTGGIMAFEPEIDRLLHWRLWHVEAQGHVLPLDGIGAAVQKAFPGERIDNYDFSTSPGLSYQVSLDRGLVYVDPYTGNVLGVRPPGMDFLGYVHQIHLRLLIRNRADTGKKIVNWAGVAMLFLLVSGIYLWWPYKRVTIERRGSAKRFWFDVHAVVGIFSFVFLLLLTVTGLTIGFERGTPRRPVRVTPVPGAKPIAPDQAVEIARRALPGASPFSINVPDAGEPYFVRSRFPEDRTPGGRSRVIIDPYTGNVIAAEGSRTAPADARLVIVNRAIHTGDIFGLPSKAVMSLASLAAVAQVVSGLLMWWKGRARKNYGRRT